MSASKLHTFDIEFAGNHGKTGRVKMDGVELSGVTNVELRGRVDSVVELCVTFLPAAVLARVTDPAVFALVQQLIAETTAMQSEHKTYTRAEAV